MLRLALARTVRPCESSLIYLGHHKPVDCIAHWTDFSFCNFFKSIVKAMYSSGVVDLNPHRSYNLLAPGSAACKTNIGLLSKELLSNRMHSSTSDSPTPRPRRSVRTQTSPMPTTSTSCTSEMTDLPRNNRKVATILPPLVSSTTTRTIRSRLKVGVTIYFT